MDNKLVALHNGKPQKVQVVGNGTIKTGVDFYDKDNEPVVECTLVNDTSAIKEEKETTGVDWLELIKLYAIFGGFGFIAGVLTTLVVLNRIGVIKIF